MKVHYSSKTPEWGTPQNFFDELDREFKFNLDPAATKENAKCKNFFTCEEDGLKQSWRDKRVFLNPPYGREIGKWVEKAATGGRGCCRLTSRSHGHKVLSPVDLWQDRDTVFKG